MLSGSGRQRYSVLGAVETRDHDFVSIRTAGSINAQVVCELLEKISPTYPGEEITLVMDNAPLPAKPIGYGNGRRPRHGAPLPSSLFSQP